MSSNMNKKVQNNCVDCNRIFSSNKAFNRCFDCRELWYNNHFRKCSECNETYRTFLDNGKRIYKCFRCLEDKFNNCRICDNKTQVNNEICSMCYKEGVSHTLSVISLQYI